MRLVARYDYAWTVIHRPQPVPGLLIELHPHYVHAVSSNPVMLGWRSRTDTWCAVGVVMVGGRQRLYVRA